MAELLEFENPRIARGRTAYLTGLSAEQIVERHYRDMGARVACRRWRGAGAEIDLVLRHGDCLVFVEVKAARSFERAAERLHWSQLHRIMRAAEVYAGQNGGMLCQMRIDAALVDGQGAVRILENVSMAA